MNLNSNWDIKVLAKCYNPRASVGQGEPPTKPQITMNPVDGFDSLIREDIMELVSTKALLNSAPERPEKAGIVRQ